MNSGENGSEAPPGAFAGMDGQQVIRLHAGGGGDGGGEQDPPVPPHPGPDGWQVRSGDRPGHQVADIRGDFAGGIDVLPDERAHLEVVQRDRHRYLGAQAHPDDGQVPPPGPVQQPGQQREEQVELHEHDHEVKVTGPGDELDASPAEDLKGSSGHRGDGVAAQAREAGQGIEQRPDDERDDDRSEPAPPEGPGRPPGPVVGLVHQHQPADEKEDVPAGLRFEQHGTVEDAAGRGEHLHRVRDDDQQGRGRAHHVELVRVRSRPPVPGPDVAATRSRCAWPVSTGVSMPYPAGRQLNAG